MRNSKCYLKKVTTFVFVFLVLYEVFSKGFFNMVVSTDSTVVFLTKDLFGSLWIGFLVYPFTTGLDSWVCEDIPDRSVSLISLFSVDGLLVCVVNVTCMCCGLCFIL